MSTWLKRGLAAAVVLAAAWGAPAVLAQDDALVVVHKAAGHEIVLGRARLLELPQHELTERPMNFPEAHVFRGPLLSDVLKVAGASGDATLTASDDYQVTITQAEMAAHNPILAVDLDGVQLAGHDFGPYFVMWPFKEKPEIDNEAFQSKAIWQVVRIEVQ